MTTDQDWVAQLVEKTYANPTINSCWTYRQDRCAYQLVNIRNTAKVPVYTFRRGDGHQIQLDGLEIRKEMIPT